MRPALPRMLMVSMALVAARLLKGGSLIWWKLRKACVGRDGEDGRRSAR